MTPLWTAQELAEATGGRVEGDFAVKGVAFDSREIEPGDLFIAMKGESADGSSGGVPVKAPTATASSTAPTPPARQARSSAAP